MSLRPCLTCGALSPGSYCREHEPSRVNPLRRSPGTFRRRTLAKTDGRCAVPGCMTPNDGVEAHHVRALSAGGADDAESNGLPLCRRHHAEAEAAQAD